MFLQKIVIEKLRFGIILSFFCPPKLCDQKKALETFIDSKINWVKKLKT